MSHTHNKGSNNIKAAWIAAEYGSKLIRSWFMDLKTFFNSQNATTLAVERAVAVAVTGVVGTVLLNWQWSTVGKWGVVYWLLKTAYDFGVKTIPNWPWDSPKIHLHMEPWDVVKEPPSLIRRLVKRLPN
jgi:hypothetical protein